MIRKEFLTLFSLLLITACDNSVTEINAKTVTDALPAVEGLQNDAVEVTSSSIGKVEYLDADDSAYNNVIRFDKSGVFYWNNMSASLEDPI